MAERHTRGKYRIIRATTRITGSAIVTLELGSVWLENKAILSMYFVISNQKPQKLELHLLFHGVHPTKWTLSQPSKKKNIDLSLLFAKQKGF